MVILMENKKNELYAGAAQVEITPEPGLDLTGFITRLGPSTGIHDPLYATTLALSDGQTRAALINCDLLGLDADFVSAVRQKIQTATGIPAANIMIACTHTHSGPATFFLQGCGEVDPAYMAGLPGKLVESVQNALAALQAVQVGAARGSFSQGVADRRDAHAPIDPDVGVIYLRNVQDRPAAVLVNYACHPTVMKGDNRLVSADYPGYLRQAIQRRLGAPVLFLTGACGNINSVQVGSFAFCQALGEALAAEALRLIDTLPPSSFVGRDSIPPDLAGPVSNPPVFLSIESQVIRLPMFPPPPLEELHRLAVYHAQKQLEAEGAGLAANARVEKAMSGWAVRILDQIQRGALQEALTAEIQVLRLGEAVIAGIPGEMFSTLGQAIKRGAGDRPVYISTLTNGDVGYIPESTAYAQGGYEISEAYKYYGHPAALSPKAGERIIITALRQITGRMPPPEHPMG
jgi:neutral ceramidase